MSRVLILPCGHPYDLPPGASAAGSTLVCPVCRSSCDTPPPPRLAGNRPGSTDASTVPRPDLPPAGPLPRVAGYEDLVPLGKGGMGVVYRAHQRSLNRLVALKMVHTGLSGDAEYLARLRTEAEAAARLQHPNIVQVHEVGTTDGQPYLVLELVEGGSLRDRLHDGPLAPGDAARLVETLARAMAYAHQRGVVHRDLKPANVLLTSPSPPTPLPRSGGEGREITPLSPPGRGVGGEGFGTPKIADFGLAKQLDADSGQTRSGAVLGTPSYMAPEQAEGRVRDVGPLADVYALGAILYECLTGRPPFRGATVLDTLEQVRLSEPVPPRHLQPKVPRDLETIALKCLAKEPHCRYASAAALADDLARFREGRPIRARPVGPLGRFTRWCRRAPVVAGLAAGLFVALAAGLGGVGWKWHEADGQRRRAKEAEARATARAEAEAAARARAEQAERDTARAMDFVADGYVATTFNALADGTGPLLSRFSKPPATIQAFRHFCAAGEQLLAAHPSGPLQGALAKSYAQLSVLLAAARQRDEAVRCARRGAELLDGRGLADPASLGNPEALGQTAFVLGAVLMNLGRNEEAIEPFREAVRRQRAALEEAPADAKRRKALSVSYYHLDHVLLAAGHVPESAASVRERQRLWPDNANEVYDTACELAHCAQAVGSGKPDAALTDAERAERRHYGDEAVAALRKAIGLGLKDAGAVRADADLAILRERADFRELVDDMAKREAKTRQR
jgi:serine/threonine protein kinase